MVNSNGSVQVPRIKGIAEVSRSSFKEIGEDEVALLTAVDDVHLDVIDLSVDYVLPDMVKVKPVGGEVFGEAIFGEVEGGKVEGGGEVGVGEVVGDLGV